MRNEKPSRSRGLSCGVGGAVSRSQACSQVKVTQQGSVLELALELGVEIRRSQEQQSTPADRYEKRRTKIDKLKNVDEHWRLPNNKKKEKAARHSASVSVFACGEKMASLSRSFSNLQRSAMGSIEEPNRASDRPASPDPVLPRLTRRPPPDALSRCAGDCWFWSD